MGAALGAGAGAGAAAPAAIKDVGGAKVGRTGVKSTAKPA